jgi:hypothetical protein
MNVPPDVLSIHQNITLSADMTFGGIDFLLATSTNLQFINIENCKIVVSAIVEVVNSCRSRGFIVQICLMDNTFEVIRAPPFENGIA